MSKYELQFLMIMLRGRVDRASRLAARGERGASAVEWVVITAILVGVAIAVGAILVPKIKGKAHSVSFDTPQ